MSKDDRKLLLCNCNHTMALDAKGLAGALDLESVPHVHSALCRRHLGAFEGAVKGGDELTVACTQEAQLFTELNDELKGAAPIRFVNIRETAGWSAEARGAGAKTAALLALASVPEPEPVAAVSYASAGRTLIVGPGAAALAWAEQLSAQLTVSVLMTDGGRDCELPVERRYAVFSGNAITINGHLGFFKVNWQQSNPIDLELCTRCNACLRACPEGAIDYAYQVDLEKCREHRRCVAACGDVHAIDFERLEADRDETFDLVLDLSAEPLIKHRQPPQGYFAPGRDPLEQALAARKLAELTGEFEKPRFVTYREKVCAHSRSEIVACTKCIDVCSAGAISSDVEGNRIEIDPYVCAGCGGCATACPSGAVSYAYPRLPDMGARLKVLLQTYRKAGGKDAALIFHDANGGRELIARLGRSGRGLPARVIPLEVFHIGALGIDLLLGCIALGAARCLVLSTGTEAPEYVESLRFQLGVANGILEGLGFSASRLTLVETDEPAALARMIWNLEPASELPAATFNFAADKRGTLDFALEHLSRVAAKQDETIPLPPGAPFGTIVVDRQSCTLCMACVGACPEGALLDAKEAPQLKFIERNCVQCGLCAKTCPEDAITLAPRLLLGQAAKTATCLNEAAVFGCVKCGKPFATKQMIENMLARLGAHSMFSAPGALERLKMCADCRVIDLWTSEEHGSIHDH